MPFAFKPSKRRGTHYELTELALRRLRTANLLLKARPERNYEFAIVSHLQASPKLRRNLITQVADEEVEKIHQASLFGFKHRS